MGKRKLEIKARESKEWKQVTFSKRRMGLQKKAQELSTLCDIPLLLLLFSPGHRLSWVSSSSSTPEEVLLRYANISSEERATRKTEVLEQLSHAFEKTGHKVKIEDFSRERINSASQNVKEWLMHCQSIQMEGLENLRQWYMPQTLEQASRVEEVLEIRLRQIHSHMSMQKSSKDMVLLHAQPLAQQPLLDSSHNNVPYGAEPNMGVYQYVAYDQVMNRSLANQEALGTNINKPLSELYADSLSQGAWGAKSPYFKNSSIFSTYYRGDRCRTPIVHGMPHHCLSTMNEFGNQLICSTCGLSMCACPKVSSIASTTDVVSSFVPSTLNQYEKTKCDQSYSQDISHSEVDSKREDIIGSEVDHQNVETKVAENINNPFVHGEEHHSFLDPTLLPQCFATNDPTRPTFDGQSYDEWSLLDNNPLVRPFSEY